MNSGYRLVPGHEIAGRVVEVGGQVSHFKPGDIGGVGVMVDALRPPRRRAKMPVVWGQNRWWCRAMPRKWPPAKPRWI
ncbi:alcohol dehydrogenase catalytic domain-containing protein [Serratia sp. AKBS12]|uniref:alcohol dehydrogenase catalytic domain-containing protein n=1 Tax=Serratia sp. AKBS12 TaxID=2974597 RepID=UPI00286CC28E|nr:alcohol dehydrogenase catalytic domain-containing protein [Serratia sp. AKBS12]